MGSPMHADSYDIWDLFYSQIRFSIPIYQRPYVWDEENQWRPFWTDTRELAGDLLAGKPVKPHFLGAVVIDMEPRPLVEVKAFTVVDGQQRLTTVQVFLEALADNLECVCDEGCETAREYAEKSRAVTRNQWATSDPGKQFKVWPLNVDQLAFRAVMTAGSPEELRETQATTPCVIESQIAKAYVYFYECVSEWLRDQEEMGAAVRALFNALNNHTQIVVIDLRNSVDPQLIFETLNARNTPLTASDLVKNYLFRRATVDGEDVAALYERLWQPFENDYDYWNAKVGKGIARTERLNVFMHHYLVMKLRRDVDTGRRLYSEYCAFAEDSSMTTVELLTELAEYGEVYKGLDQLPVHSPAAVFMARLRAMDNTTVLPFVLALMADSSVSGADRTAILRQVESYLVRRAVCNMTQKAYNRVFVDLLAATDASGMSPGSVGGFLLTRSEETNRWPTDVQFRAAWRHNKAYNFLTLAKLRMILLAVEPFVKSEKSETVSFVEDKLTVEHLLPQSWHAHYPLPSDGSVDEVAREQNIHSLGNLTLLTTKLNSAVSNGPWRVDGDEDKGKRAAILKHAALGISRMLVEYREWNDQTIFARGEQLFAAALKVWPRPSQ